MESILKSHNIMLEITLKINDSMLLIYYLFLTKYTILINHCIFKNYQKLNITAWS